jgi:hypothetical protein
LIYKDAPAGSSQAAKDLKETPTPLRHVVCALDLIHCWSFCGINSNQKLSSCMLMQCTFSCNS